MAHKIFVSLLLSLLYLAKQSEADGYWTTDLVLGDRCDFTDVLSEGECSTGGEWLQTQHKWCTFTANGQRIGCIKVENLWKDGTGGYVFSVPASGGIGQDYVDFHFKSQLSHGFRSKVTLYREVVANANLTLALTKNP